MPTPVLKPVRVQYRSVDLASTQINDFNLQHALNQCVETAGTSSASQRQLTLEDVGTLVLNFNTPSSDFFLGEIVRYEPGANLDLLRASESAEGIFDLAQLSPPNGHNALKGTFYFYVVNNHVMIIEGDISAARVERYLTHLLRDRCNLLPDTGQIILDAQLRASGDGSQLSNVNEIVFQPAPVFNVPDARIQAERRQSTTTTTSGFTGSNALDVMLAAGMTGTDIARLTGDNAHFELTLTIKFKQGRKKSNLSNENVNHLLRNLPEDELTLNGPAGKQRHGTIVKLSHTTKVLKNGSIFVYSDVARVFREAYVSFLDNGNIG